MVSDGAVMGKCMAHLVVSLLLTCFLCSGVHCSSEKAGVEAVSPPAVPPAASGWGGLSSSAARTWPCSLCLEGYGRRHLGGSLPRRARVAAFLRPHGSLHPDRQVSLFDVFCNSFRVSFSLVFWCGSRGRLLPVCWVFSCDLSRAWELGFKGLWKMVGELKCD